MRPIATLQRRRSRRLRPCLSLLVALAGACCLPLRQAQASPPAQAAPSTCLPNATTVVSPGVLLAGEEATVQLSFSLSCGGAGRPLHLVFVLDESGSMQGDPINQLQQAVKTIVRGMQLPDNPTTQIGIVAFQSVARTLCKPMNDEGRLVGCASKVRAGGGTAIDRGIIEGIKGLIASRTGLPPGVTANEVMILTTNGENNAGCPAMTAAANRAKVEGIAFVTVGIGAGTDAACLRDGASSPRLAFQIAESSQLVDVFGRLNEVLHRRFLTTVQIVDSLPANMTLVPGPISPPAKVSADLKQLTWDFEHPVDATLQVSYRIRPLEAGSHPVSAGAVADFVDGLNRTGRAAFPIPQVSVFGVARAGAAASDSLKVDRHLSAKVAKDGY